MGIIGFALYFDILPVGKTNSSVKFIPTVETIQQISNVLLPDENQIIYYSFEDVPDIPDKKVPISALKQSIESWEFNNPNLKFVESENPNIEIRWKEYSSSTHTGLAICNSVLFGILSHCILNVSVGAIDCNKNFIQNDENMVANILMHEIGHALKLEHTNQTGHLMYSYEFPQDSFDDMGYVIPQRFEELYIGQDILLDKEKEMRIEIESLDKKLSDEKSLYDKYLKDYKYYENKILSSKEIQTTNTLFENLKNKTDQINNIINQQNTLIDKVNSIVNQLGCNPNFKIS